MNVERLNTLPDFSNKVKNKVTLEFLEAKELNKGDEITYYIIYVDEVNKTEEIFQEKKIACTINRGTQLEGDIGCEFIFIPHDNGILVSKKDWKKYKLKVFFKQMNKITYDTYRGNYFRGNYHVLINKRSIVITDLNTLKNNKIRFNANFDIEWGVLINDEMIRIIQANNVEIVDYDIKKEKIARKHSLPINKDKFMRFFFRGQIENMTYLEASLKDKGNYCELIKLIH